MFSLFKSDPVKKLRMSYYTKLEQAMRAQRKGDIEPYSLLSSEAEELMQQIEALESSKN